MSLFSRVKRGLKLGPNPVGHPLAGYLECNTVLKRFEKDVEFNAGGTVADGATYKKNIIMLHAGKLTKAMVTATTPPIGGTSTVKITNKTTSTAMTVAASLDPTTLVAYVGKDFPVLTTAAGSFAAGDVIEVELVAGTQTTDSINMTASLELEYKDF